MEKPIAPAPAEDARPMGERIREYIRQGMHPRDAAMRAKGIPPERRIAPPAGA